MKPKAKIGLNSALKRAKLRFLSHLWSCEKGWYKKRLKSPWHIPYNRRMTFSKAPTSGKTRQISLTFHFLEETQDPFGCTGKRDNTQTNNPLFKNSWHDCGLRVARIKKKCSYHHKWWLGPFDPPGRKSPTNWASSQTVSRFAAVEKLCLGSC